MVLCVLYALSPNLTANPAKQVFYAQGTVKDNALCTTLTHSLSKLTSSHTYPPTTHQNCIFWCCLRPPCRQTQWLLFRAQPGGIWPSRPHLRLKTLFPSLSGCHTPGFLVSPASSGTSVPNSTGITEKSSGARLLSSYPDLLHLLTVILGKIFNLLCLSLLHRVVQIKE